MSYYQTCPNCGAHLDPGESCECEKEKGEEQGMTLEKIESMNLTEDLLVQIERDPTPENIALMCMLEARDTLDNCGGDRQAAREWLCKAFYEYDPECKTHSFVHRMFLRAVDVLADYRAKKAANPHADQSKGLTATEETAKALRQQG